MITIIILLCVASAANAFMDTINFHFPGSRLDNGGNWWGPIEETWTNKYRFSGIARWLFRGPLVFLTDGWHFFQFVMFTSYQVLIALLMPNLWVFIPRWANIIGMVLLMKIIHGLIFEPFYILLSMNETEKRAALLWIKQKWWIVSVAILGIGFFLPYVMVYNWGLAEGWWLVSEIVIAALAIVGCVKFILWAQKPLKRDRLLLQKKNHNNKQ